MLKELLNEIGITIIKPEGDGQLKCICPDCQTDHLYIDKVSGLWDCKKGCGQGHIFELVHKQTRLADKQCFELLEKYGLNNSDYQLVEPKSKDISWFTEQLRTATENELQYLCQIKLISDDALLKYGLHVHQSEPIACIPGYDPDTGSVCGYLRIGKDGQLVKLKSGKEEKYPAIGQHGLFGLPWLQEQEPETIIFCEGWRDALAAINAGYYATASSGGASTFKDSWLSVFRDKTVYIIMDADEAGQKAAERAARKISGVARNVFIVNLPYEVTESKGKDLHDHLVTDDGSLELLLSAATKYEPQSNLSLAGKIILTSDQPDDIAKMIDDYCRKKLNIIHRYNSTDGWSEYRNNRYRRIEDENEIDVFIRKFLRRCVVEKRKKDDNGNVEISHRPLRRKSSGFVRDVKGYWQALDGVHIFADKKAPSSLDGKNDPQYIIALRNGLLDYSQYPYKLLPHTSEFYSFNQLEFDWAGERDSELWIKFLHEITCGDEELFLLLQQWAGYLLTSSNDQQKFLLCFGDGANGKSVFFDIMAALLGVSNCSSVPLSQFNNVKYLTQTYGKMANISDESSKILNDNIETALKQYCGGTKVTFCYHYKMSFSAYPTAKVMIATNSLPHFADTSNGIWRRMLLVPFNATIPEAKQDKQLAEKIKASDMPGILKWALEGLKSLREMGHFIEPKTCLDALDQYKRDVNPLIVFLEENYTFTGVESDMIETEGLYNRYRKWCEGQGYCPKNDSNVGKQIKKLWPGIEKKRPREYGVRVGHYSGLIERP